MGIFGHGNKLRLDYMLDVCAAERLVPALEEAGFLVSVDFPPYLQLTISRRGTPDTRLALYGGDPPAVFTTQMLRDPPTDDVSAALLELATSLDEIMQTVGASYLPPPSSVHFRFRSKCPSFGENRT